MVFDTATELVVSIELTSGSILGIAGGANGGDTLFLEVCGELGIKTEMLLALPENQFIEASVDNDDKSWLRRFHAQLDMHPDSPVLAGDEKMHCVWQDVGESMQHERALVRDDGPLHPDSEPCGADGGNDAGDSGGGGYAVRA